MKKKLLSFILATFMFVPCMFLFSACGKDENPQEPSEHTHTYVESTWKNDATQHWHECTATDCDDLLGSKKDMGAHIYTDTDDANCNICGYERTLPKETTFAFTTAGQNKEITYNGKAVTFTRDTDYTITDNDGNVVSSDEIANSEIKFLFKLKDGDAEYSSTAPKNVGTYLVKLVFDGNADYKKLNADVISEFTINKKDINLPAFTDAKPFVVEFSGREYAYSDATAYGAVKNDDVKIGIKTGTYYYLEVRVDKNHKIINRPLHSPNFILEGEDSNNYNLNTNDANKDLCYTTVMPKKIDYYFEKPENTKVVYQVSKYFYNEDIIDYLIGSNKSRAINSTSANVPFRVRVSVPDYSGRAGVYTENLYACMEHYVYDYNNDKKWSYEVDYNYEIIIPEDIQFTVLQKEIQMPNFEPIQVSYNGLNYFTFGAENSIKALGGVYDTHNAYYGYEFKITVEDCNASDSLKMVTNVEIVNSYGNPGNYVLTNVDTSKIQITIAKQKVYLKGVGYFWFDPDDDNTCLGYSTTIANCEVYPYGTTGTPIKDVTPTATLTVKKEDGITFSKSIKYGKAYITEFYLTDESYESAKSSSSVYGTYSLSGIDTNNYEIVDQPLEVSYYKTVNVYVDTNMGSNENFSFYESFYFKDEFTIDLVNSNGYNPFAQILNYKVSSDKLKKVQIYLYTYSDRKEGLIIAGINLVETEVGSNIFKTYERGNWGSIEASYTGTGDDIVYDSAKITLVPHYAKTNYTIFNQYTGEYLWDLKEDVNKFAISIIVSEY